MEPSSASPSPSAAVQQCLSALQNATGDSERLAALLVVTRVIEPDSCDPQILRRLFSYVGFEFPARLLSTARVEPNPNPDPERHVPGHVYASLAVALLSSFATVPELAEHPGMLERIPTLVRILEDDEDPASCIRKDALLCLGGVSATTNGCNALLEHVPSLVGLLGKSWDDRVLAVSMAVAERCGPECWRFHGDATKNLAGVLVDRMIKETSVRKFELYDSLAVVVRCMPEGAVALEEEGWCNEAREELLKVLQSRLWYSQHAPCLRLLSAFVERLSLRWALGGPDDDDRFLLLLVQLVCVESRLLLEGESLGDASQSGDVAATCFVILEAAVAFLAEDDDAVSFEHRKSLYQSLTDTFGSVVGFLRAVGASLKPGSLRLQLPQEQWHFLEGIVRVLGAWLAEETEALRDEVYEVLPSVLRVAVEDPDSDGLRFLLPGLCHLSVEDESRAILLEHEIPERVVRFLQTTWTEHAREHDSSMTVACGVLMNIVVLEVGYVSREGFFMELLRFVLRAVPHLDRQRQGRLPLYGHAAILGLLLLRHHSGRLRTSDAGIYRYLSATVRFLWDAYNVDDSRDFCSLVVATSYRPAWDEVKELWFLGLRALGSLLPALPWIAAFVVESGWCQDIVRSFSRVKAANVEASVRVALEDFLCRLVAASGGDGGVSSSSSPAKALLDHGALRVCEIHEMPALRRALQGR